MGVPVPLGSWHENRHAAKTLSSVRAMLRTKRRPRPEHKQQERPADGLPESESAGGVDGHTARAAAASASAHASARRQSGLELQMLDAGDAPPAGRTRRAGLTRRTTRRATGRAADRAADRADLALERKDGEAAAIAQRARIDDREAAEPRCARARVRVSVHHGGDAPLREWRRQKGPQAQRARVNEQMRR